MSVVQDLRAGFTAAATYAGRSLTVQSRAFTTDDPFSEAAQWTVADERTVRGLKSALEKRSPTEGEGHSRRTLFTFNSASLYEEPNAGTIIGCDSKFYTTGEVRSHQNAIYQVFVGGAVQDATLVADVTGPRFSATNVNDGETTLTWSATSNEGAHIRIRYRKGDFAPWTTGTWTSGDYETSHAGTTPELPSPGLWTVMIQGRDAASNVGAWFDLGTGTTSGTPA